MKVIGGTYLLYKFKSLLVIVYLHQVVFLLSRLAGNFDTRYASVQTLTHSMPRISSNEIENLNETERN